MAEEMVRVSKSELRAYKELALARLGDLRLKRDLMAADMAEIERVVERIDGWLDPDFSALQKQGEARLKQEQEKFLRDLGFNPGDRP